VGLELSPSLGQHLALTVISTEDEEAEKREG